MTTPAIVPYCMRKMLLFNQGKQIYLHIAAVPGSTSKSILVARKKMSKVIKLKVAGPVSEGKIK